MDHRQFESEHAGAGDPGLPANNLLANSQVTNPPLLEAAHSCRNLAIFFLLGAQPSLDDPIPDRCVLH